MKLNIVYGRSGTGKSEYIYKDITRKIGNRNIFLVVPEQCNLSAEKKLFEISNKECLIDVEVLTLSRMAYRVANEVGGEYNHLSKAGKDMLIFDLISKEKANLNFLGKSEKNIDIVNRMFTELKKHNVGIQDLKNADIRDNYTKLKLNDVTLLYEKYEEKLLNNFIDENDALTILCENLDQTTMFDDCIIYIDEFLGFTPQEYNVFEKLIKKCAEITVSISADNLQNNLPKEHDIYYFNKKYANKLIDIKIFLASNPYTEIEYVAQTIHNLVKKCGYKYNEIGIISEDLEKYSEDVKAICNKYDIPLFVDEKKELNQNILIKFILALIEVFSKNWSYEAVFNYLKIGLLDIPKEDIYNLENYCIKWGIKGTKWNKEFAYEQINDNQEKLENLRRKILTPLIEFKTNVSSNKTAIRNNKRTL